MLVPDKKLDDILLTGLLRLNAKLQGVVTGIILGFLIFIATNWLLIKGGTVGPEGKTMVGPHLALLGQYFIGYRVSFFGSLIGFAYGFAVGFIGGYFISTMYNWLVERKERGSAAS
jgi:hypothetical protein